MAPYPAFNAHMPIAYATFDPPLDVLGASLEGSTYAAFCGPNNSGKSLALKALSMGLGTSHAPMLSVNRFISDLPLVRKDQSHSQGSRGNVDLLGSNMNSDGIYVDLSPLVVGMSDV